MTGELAPLRVRRDLVRGLWLRLRLWYLRHLSLLSMLFELFLFGIEFLLTLYVLVLEEDPPSVGLLFSQLLLKPFLFLYCLKDILGLVDGGCLKRSLDWRSLGVYLPLDDNRGHRVGLRWLRQLRKRLWEPVGSQRCFGGSINRLHGVDDMLA